MPIKNLFFMLIMTHFSIYASNIEVAKLSDKTVCLGFDNGDLGQFDLDSFEMINRIKAHDFSVTDIAFSHDNSQIATVAADGVKIWESATLRPISYFPISANSVAFNPQNNRQLLVSGFNLIVLIDIEDGKKIANLPHKGTAKASFNHQGSQILVTDFNQSLVTIYDVKSKNIVYSMSEYWPYHATFSHDDQKVIVSAGSKVIIYDINLRKVQTFTHTKPFSHDHDNWILRSESSVDDRYITSIDNAGCLIRLEVANSADKIAVVREPLRYSNFFENDKKLLLVTKKSIYIFESKAVLVQLRKKSLL